MHLVQRARSQSGDSEVRQYSVRSRSVSAQIFGLRV